MLGEAIVDRVDPIPVFGPQQIVNRINQDAEISQQISLWDQRGSEVIQGNLFVIPIEESILYVRPLYLRAEGGQIPELKRVIVAFENTISMGETLEEALAIERALKEVWSDHPHYCFVAANADLEGPRRLR